MTREETIKWLESLKSEIGKSEHRSLWHYAESIDMAIEALSADATCATCADRAMCIMSAPDGKWKACKDYRPSAEAESEAVREISGDCKPLFFGVDYGKLKKKGGDSE